VKKVLYSGKRTFVSAVLLSALLMASVTAVSAWEDGAAGYGAGIWKYDLSSGIRDLQNGYAQIKKGVELASSGTADIKLGIYVQPWNPELEQGRYRELIGELKQHKISRIFIFVYSPKGEGKGVFQIVKKGSWHGATNEPEFLNVPDLATLIQVVHHSGIQVHAVICCFGGAGDEYPQYSVNPTSEVHRKHLLEVIGYLLENFPSLDGIQLDYIRYIREHGYKADGDTDTIANFIGDVNNIVKSKILSATVFPATYENWCDPLVHWLPWLPHSDYYEVWHDLGQDYRKMQRYLNFISPMAYHRECSQPPNWVGKVVKFTKQKLTENCGIIPDIQTFYETKEGLEILDNPGYEEVKNALQSAIENNVNGINIFVYGTISKEEWKAIDEVLG